MHTYPSSLDLEISQCLTQIKFGWSPVQGNLLCISRKLLAHLQFLGLSVEASFWPYCALCNFTTEIAKCRNLHGLFQSSDERWVSSYDDWAVFCSQGLNGLYLDGAFFSLWALLTHKQVWVLFFFVYAWHKHTLMNASCLYFGMQTGWTRNLPVNSQPALFSHHPSPIQGQPCLASEIRWEGCMAVSADRVNLSVL